MTGQSCRGALPTVCILAGGRGTRLREVAADRPKALVEVAGQPFLFHQLRLLADNGARRVVLCVGYLGEQVRATLGEQHFGLELLYSFDAPGLDGTLGAIRRASRLLGERFLVQYGDTYLQVDYGAFASGWQRSGRCAAMAVLHNAGRWGASNVSFHDGRIERYDKNHPTADMEWIDYGLGGFTSAALAMVPQPERDLSVLQSELAGRRELYGFAATKRFYEIGTPTALRETDRYLRSRAIG